MYTFAVTLLLGLALFKLVDVLEDLAPDTTKLHGLVTTALAVVGAFVMDYSLFDGWGVALREDWMGTFLTGLVIAGTTSIWRAGFHWLGSADGEEPEVRHQRRTPVRAA
jgi:Mn2+/Fe2+ NRAMP family transporter